MVDINSVQGIESLIEKKTRPLKGQIRELQTELIALKEALNIHIVSKCCKCGKNEGKGKTNQCDNCLMDGIM